MENFRCKLPKKKIKWVWVKGHSGNTYNDKVDEIARNQAETL